MIVIVGEDVDVVREEFVEVALGVNLRSKLPQIIGADAEPPFAVRGQRRIVEQEHIALTVAPTAAVAWVVRSEERIIKVRPGWSEPAQATVSEGVTLAHWWFFERILAAVPPLSFIEDERYRVSTQ